MCYKLFSSNSWKQEEESYICKDILPKETVFTKGVTLIQNFAIH